MSTGNIKMSNTLMGNTVSHGNTFAAYHAEGHKRSNASGFQIYLVALIGLAVAAFLFSLAPL
jgi:hypothetical protein